MNQSFPSLAVTALLLASPLLHAAATFNEVYDVVFGAAPAPENDEQAQEQRVYQQRGLPQYKITVNNFFEAGVNLLEQDAIRTVSETADYYPRLEKRVHSNGICFTGTWTITEETPYTGYFKKGATGLLIARASTALSETRRGQPRAFGFAGKLFPTLDPDLATETVNFFLADVLAGVQRDHYLDVTMTNQPETGFRFSVIVLGLQIASAFSKADKDQGIRPLYPIAELGLAGGELAKSPQFMLLQASAATPRNDEVDFRDELNLEKSGSGDLMFDILVSDVSPSKTSGHWGRIGAIVLTKSVVSYGCDRRLHFAHPKMK
ncbi:MAG: hypothetical protein ABR553_10325 [Gammaproteobacteria bacterium]